MRKTCANLYNNEQKTSDPNEFNILDRLLYNRRTRTALSLNELRYVSTMR